MQNINSMLVVMIRVLILVVLLLYLINEMWKLFHIDSVRLDQLQVVK